jgi:lipoprotein-releasing system permease protein
MRLPFFIAKRYFFSKKSHRAINVISMISVVGVTIGTSALIIVLSVFNGFEDIILKLYNSFDPDLKVELKEGKTFATNQIDLKKLRSIDGVMYVNEVIEESALAKYHDRQYIIRVKGVGDDFTKMTGLDTMIVEGKLKLQEGGKNFAVFGSGVAYNLDINPENIFNDVEIYGVRRSAGGMNELEGSFNRMFIQPSGVFAVQQEFDERYVIVPIGFARELFEYDSLLTSLEIKLKAGENEDEVVSRIAAITGSQFVISNRAEQHKIINNIMKSEKWVVFAILVFILTIAIFNVVSSQTMLVIEKKRDIAIFRSMGAENSFMRKVFLIEGMFITIGGAICGLLIGLVICYIQIRFGVITLGGNGSFVIDAYPVKLVFRDFFYVMSTVCLIGFLAAWYPSRRLIRSDSGIIEEFR